MSRKNQPLDLKRLRNTWKVTSTVLVQEIITRAKLKRTHEPSASLVCLINNSTLLAALAAAVAAQIQPQDIRTATRSKLAERGKEKDGLQKKRLNMRSMCTDSGRKGGKAAAKTLGVCTKFSESKKLKRRTHIANTPPWPIACEVEGNTKRIRRITSVRVARSHTF